MVSERLIAVGVVLAQTAFAGTAMANGHYAQAVGEEDLSFSIKPQCVANVLSQFGEVSGWGGVIGVEQKTTGATFSVNVLHTGKNINGIHVAFEVESHGIKHQAHVDERPTNELLPDGSQANYNANTVYFRGQGETTRDVVSDLYVIGEKIKSGCGFSFP